MEAILASLELKQLHILQRVNSTFKNLITTSPSLREIALARNGYATEPRGLIHHEYGLRRRAFLVCDRGSDICFPLHGYGYLAVNVTLLASGHSKRTRAFWEGILLSDVDQKIWFKIRDRISGEEFIVKLGLGDTLGDLIDKAVSKVKTVYTAEQVERLLRAADRLNVVWRNMQSWHIES